MLDSGCKMISFPKISDQRGNLTFVESAHHVPFNIQRVYYVYDVPGGERRGGHCHRTIHQVIIAVSGSFDVKVFDGETTTTFILNRAHQGLYIPPMTWREVENFASGSVSLVLVSDLYKESDYIRDYNEYIHFIVNAKENRSGI